MWKMERNTNNILDIHTHKAEPVSAGKAIINRKLATDALYEGYFYSAGIHIFSVGIAPYFRSPGAAIVPVPALSALLPNRLLHSFL